MATPTSIALSKLGITSKSTFTPVYLPIATASGRHDQKQRRSVVDAVNHSSHIRRNTQMSLLLFVVSVVVFVVSGMMSIASTSSSYGNRCFSLERLPSYVATYIVFLNSNLRMKLLLRLDHHVDCDAQPSITIFNTRVILTSATVECEGTQCHDWVLLHSGSRNVAVRVNFSYGVSHLFDMSAYNLGLDGEIYMCTGFKYIIDDQQVCWDQITATDKVEKDPTMIPLRLTNGKYTTERCPDATRKWGLVDDPTFVSVCGDICDAANEPAKNVSETMSVVATVMSADSYQMSEFMGAPTSVLVETLTRHSQYEHAAISSVSSECKSSMGARNQRLRKTYETMCKANEVISSQTACNIVNIVPVNSYAAYTLTYEHRSLENSFLQATHNKALEGHNLVYSTQEEHNGVLEASVQLLVVLLAAAVVQVRTRELVNSQDGLFLNCLRMTKRIRYGKSDGKRINGLIKDEQQSVIVNLFAILVRTAVVFMMAPVLISSRYERVAYLQIIGCVASCVHWLMLWRHGQSVVRRLSLGGSNAIIDVSNAILVVFSRPPLRVDTDVFYALARLLTVTLVMVTIPTRCFFSSACAGAIYGWRTWYAAGFWYTQLVVSTVVVVDVTIVPTATDMNRGTIGDFTSLAFMLFAITCCLAGPRLTANALAILNDGDFIRIDEGAPERKS